MIPMPDFTVEYPETIEAAARLLAGKDGARLLAGGTDLVTNLRHGIGAPVLLVSLDHVKGLCDIAADGDALRIGAGVTLARLVSDTGVMLRFPALAAAAAMVAGPAHRSAATLGGNLCLDTRCLYYNQSEGWRRSNGYCLKYRGEICHVAPQGKRCHAAFSGDVAPVLLVLGAEAEIVGPAGTRRVPIGELYRDDGAQHLALERGELLAAVRVQRQRPALRTAYRKARTRGAIDFPLAGVAVALEIQQGRVCELRVALTGTNPRPLLLAGTEELCGQAPDQTLLDKLMKLVQRQASPQRTTVTASNYRRQVAAAIAARLVSELAVSG
jgi:4-hydroxybenzoyl-CoA reductase subunit beta